MANRSPGDLPHFSSRQAIVGWRGWNIAHPHFLMTANNTVWIPQERTEAVCTARYHTMDQRVPVEGCSCGIYAFAAPHEVEQQGYTSQGVLGEVWLWGKVIEHSRGFKAEYAYPKTIFIKDEQQYDAMNVPVWIRHIPKADQYKRYRELAEFVAFRYGVPFEIVGEGHPIYRETPEEQLKRAEQERITRLRLAAERAIKRQKNAAMMAAAKRLPATKPGYATLWDQIEAESNERVRDAMNQPKKP